MGEQQATAPQQSQGQHDFDLASQPQALQTHEVPQQAQFALAFDSVVALAEMPEKAATARAAIVPKSVRRIIFRLLF